MTVVDPEKAELRRDAQARRERLIRAAAELFASDGLDVPLEKIADRAGVGRGTLYRNFPDREALLAAALQVRLGELAEQVAQWPDRSDAIFLAIRALATLGLSSHGFDTAALLRIRAPSFIKRIRRGLEAILEEPLARAKAAGLVRPDFPIGDVHLLTVMVQAGGLGELSGDAQAGMDRALQLLARGYAPRS
jgi:AcrR family transcriptional regulator